MKNYYDILGLETNASFDEIKAAYKALVKKFHPDVNPQQREFFEKKSKSINEAYEILSSPSKKSSYDIRLKEFLNRQYNNQPNNNYSKQKEEELKKREEELKRKQSEVDERQTKRENDLKRREETIKQKVNKSKEGKTKLIFAYILVMCLCVLFVIIFANSLNRNNRDEKLLTNNKDSIETFNANRSEEDSNINLKENAENKVKSNFPPTEQNEKILQTDTNKKERVLKTTFSIKTKGLYQTDKAGDGYYYYLKFYDDSTVISTTSSDNLKKVKNWFNRDEQSPFIYTGTYSIKSDSIFFKTGWKGREGLSVIYKGKIHLNEISIYSHSQINGHKSTKTYKYKR